MVMATVVTIDWGECYPQIQTRVRRQVLQELASWLGQKEGIKLASWSVQEKEMVWDIVRESMSRLLEYVQKAERGEKRPVQLLKTLISTIVRNCVDLFRRKQGLDKGEVSTPQEFVNEGGTFSAVAIERTNYATLLTTLYPFPNCFKLPVRVDTCEIVYDRLHNFRVKLNENVSKTFGDDTIVRRSCWESC